MLFVVGGVLVSGLTSPSVATAAPWTLASAISTISALEQTGAGSVRPHSLLDVMIDDESGLCSEGVWHNSWLGVSRVLAARKLREIGEDAEASRFIDSAFMLGESLHEMSFDGSGFRRRTSSGYWESWDAASAAAIEESARTHRSCGIG